MPYYAYKASLPSISGNTEQKMEDTIRAFFSQHVELFFGAMGLFFMVSAWFDWDWVYEPPYNPVKNPVGFWFGRKAYRLTCFMAGLIIMLCVLVVLYTKHLA